jgi:Tfp pilus assembly protein PilV
MKPRITNQDGFTLMELLIYLGIVTVAIVVFSGFMANVTTYAARARVKQEVQQSARFILERITHDVRTADSVTVVAGALQLTNAGMNSCIQRDGASVVLDDCGGGSPSSLSSGNVRVTDLTFVPAGDGVSVDLNVEQADAAAQPALQGSIGLSSNIVPRRQLY